MLAHLCPAWGKHGFLPRGVGVPVGQVVPDVAGLAWDGKSIRLRDLVAQQSPVVLIFYRGAFDGFAAYQLRAISVQAQAFRDSGARLLFISNDTPQQMAETMAIHKLEWATLADPDRSITRAFQLEGRFDDKDVAVAARDGVSLPVDAKGERLRYTNPAVFVGIFFVILTMYGGGFATIPAYLADIFGTQYVGAIHGRLLTAWSTAGILGPILVNYIREFQSSRGVPAASAYNVTMYLLAAMLVVGFFCNLAMTPVKEEHFMSDLDLATMGATPAK